MVAEIADNLAMSDPTAPRPTVLAVDDTPDNLSLLSDILKEDYRVLAAKSGEKALQLALTKAPDVVLLDVQMPEMDGWEVCRKLKKDPATRDIPVIFLSAAHGVAEANRGRELGAFDFLAKPIDPDLVLERIARALEGRR